MCFVKLKVLVINLLTLNIEHLTLLNITYNIGVDSYNNHKNLAIAKVLESSEMIGRLASTAEGSPLEGAFKRILNRT